jgi:hypothetical protein
MGRNTPEPDVFFPPANATRSTKELLEKKREEKDRQYVFLKTHSSTIEARLIYSRCRTKWITTIDDVTTKLKLFLNNREEKKLGDDEEVRLAIIDDGFFPERDDMDKFVVDHEAFGEDDGDYSEWQAAYQSTYGHGHLMACIIKRVCPRVKLYVAKLDEEFLDGRSQITTTSAAKVRILPSCSTTIGNGA